MTGDLVLNNGTVDNTADILLGPDQVPLSNQDSDEVDRTPDAVDNISEEIQLTTSPRWDSQTETTSRIPESTSQTTVIIATVVVSCFVVLILIFCIFVRPYLRRKAIKAAESPIDTSRAPMDLEFRQPKKKSCFKDRVSHCSNAVSDLSDLHFFSGL